MTRRPRRRRSTAAAVLVGLALAVTWLVLRGTLLDDAASPARDRVGLATASMEGGPIRVSGTLRRGQAWSAIKVPLAAAFLHRRAEAAGTSDGVVALTGPERGWIRRALTRSDNEAASRLFWRMAGGRSHAQRGRTRLAAMLRRGGDRHSRVRVQFGTTVWRLADAVRVYRRLALGCLVGRRDTAYLLRLMRRVRSSERWGVPEAVPRSTPVAFKGGWGPNAKGRWLVEQIAIVGSAPDARIIGVMARSRRRARSLADPRAFEAGARLVERHARRALRRP
ncbi:MAG: hypothetical protein ACRDL4_20665, partial [Thermoleophilaceae bacterium]